MKQNFTLIYINLYKANLFQWKKFLRSIWEYKFIYSYGFIDLLRNSFRIDEYWKSHFYRGTMLKSDTPRIKTHIVQNFLLILGFACILHSVWMFWKYMGSDINKSKHGLKRVDLFFFFKLTDYQIMEKSENLQNWICRLRSSICFNIKKSDQFII